MKRRLTVIPLASLVLLLASCYSYYSEGNSSGYSHTEGGISWPLTALFVGGIVVAGLVFGRRS
ncbi:hypothetical protein D3C87_1682490 [compost metagenome]